MVQPPPLVSWFDVTRIEALNDPNVWFEFVLPGARSRICKLWVDSGLVSYACGDVVWV